MFDKPTLQNIYKVDNFLTFFTKFVIISTRLPNGQKKRFYFNVLKKEKKRIIKIAKKWKKFIYMKER